MTPKDIQKRHEEVSEAQAARALLDNPILEIWKGEQRDEIMMQLLNAPYGDEGNSDRLHAQARLQALNALASSLTEKINTGMMAERQIADEKRKKERRDSLRVANG